MNPTLTLGGTIESAHAELPEEYWIEVGCDKNGRWVRLHSYDDNEEWDIGSDGDPLPDRVIEAVVIAKSKAGVGV